MHMVHSLSLLITLFDFVGHPIFQASYCKNIESNHQTSEIVDSVIWGLTSLLVTTLLKLMLKPSAFSDSHKSYPFLYNTYKKHSHMVQTLGPNLLISSFLSSVLSAPNVGGQFILSMRVVEGLFWMLCNRETSLLALCSSLRLSGSYLRH